jgi:hypothetical protein
VHDAVAVQTGGNLAVEIRKGSPQLATGLNGIIDKYGLGTTFGAQGFQESGLDQSVKSRVGAVG